MINESIIKRKFDLEERTERFAKSVVKFARKVPENSVTKILILQLVRASTSIGANYCEANNAFSRNDFKHKISICRKEARESLYWLNIISSSISASEIKALTIEAKELNLIFNAIINSTNKK